MKLFAKLTFLLAILSVLAGATFSWFESRKELEILCHSFQTGQRLSDVIRTLETGEYLSYDRASGSFGVMRVDSRYNLGTSSCTVSASDGRVVASEFRETVQLNQIALSIAVGGLLGLIAVQILLAAGASLGRFAWGGRFERLPVGLRVGSLLSGAVLLFGLVCLLERAGVIDWIQIPDLVEGTILLVTLILGLSSVANSISPSKIERRVMTPVAILLFFVCLAVLFGY